MDLTIYHNPRCSKSRQTLQLLEDKGHKPKIVEYLKTPLTAIEIGALVDALVDSVGIMPHGILRKKEADYETLGLSEQSSRAEVIDAIVKFPILMERPIVTHCDRAAIGRPPENVTKLF